MEEVLNNLIESFSELDEKEQQKEISKRYKEILAEYTGTLKALGGNPDVYINKYMHLDGPGPNFNELVYAYLYNW